MRGGVARYLHSLAAASSGKMSVIVPLEHPESDHDTAESNDEIELGRAKFWTEGWPKWLPLIARCREIGHSRLVFVSHVFPVGTSAWIASFLGKVDYVVLFHGTDLRRIKTRWKKFLLRRICNNSRLILTNSKATAGALKRLVPSAKPLILTPGVDTTNSIDKSSARKELDIDSGSRVILSVARLVERKGIDVLIQAVSRIGQSDVLLAVVGSGPYGEQLKQLAGLLDVKVRWIEDAEDDDVKKWYAAADVFCLPAREEADDVEGFGIVLLEAASAGLPVISGIGWGTGEAVLDGVTGLLVEPSTDHVADALKKLLDDPDLRKQLGQAGRERALRDFKWSDRWSMLSKALNLDLATTSPQTMSEHVQDMSEEADGLDERPRSEVSVVIPCYNHAKDLERTLDALAEQTLRPDEIVVVDDGSNDDPTSVVGAFHGHLPISIIRLPERRGAPAARNRGLDATSGAYVICLDADAELVPDALATMKQTLEDDPSASFAYADFYWGRKLFRGKDWNPQELRKMNWITTSSLIRRKDLVRFDETLKKFQDWDLWLTMAEQAKKGIWIARPLFRITERKTGISRWLPSFMHRMPWPILGWTPHEIVRYREAEKVIREKHRI